MDDSITCIRGKAMSRTAEVDAFYGGVVIAFPELEFLTLFRVPLTSQVG